MTGEQLKQEGIALVDGNNPTWMDRAVAFIAAQPFGPQFTSDEIRASMGDSCPNPNCWGAAFHIAAKQGYIERVGYMKSGLKSAHSRVISVWRRKA